MSRGDGGPAFPCEFVQHQRGEVGNNTPIMSSGSGMTLRDYFAAKAMESFMQGAVLPPGFDASEQLLFTAGRAYEVADAMLAAREEETR